MRISCGPCTSARRKDYGSISTSKPKIRSSPKPQPSPRSVPKTRISADKREWCPGLEAPEGGRLGGQKVGPAYARARGCPVLTSLVLCSTRCSGRHRPYEGLRYYYYNPATQEVKYEPPIPRTTAPTVAFPSCLRVCYAMPGTDTAYDGTRALWLSLTLRLNPRHERRWSARNRMQDPTFLEQAVPRAWVRRFDFAGHTHTGRVCRRARENATERSRKEGEKEKGKKGKTNGRKSARPLNKVLERMATLCILAQAQQHTAYMAGEGDDFCMIVPTRTGGNSMEGGNGAWLRGFHPASSRRM
eukprot:271654-Rhodomonas_salina.1